jgi:hypothetical protein
MNRTYRQRGSAAARSKTEKSFMSARGILDEKKVSLSRCRGVPMSCRTWRWAWLLVLGEALCVSAASTLVPGQKHEVASARAVPLAQIDERCRDAVRQVLEKPILSGRGPAESFYCRPEHYSWLLEHPDRVVHAWRRLGARCVSIDARSGGRFGWADENGSELVWETVLRSPSMRIWFAEGKVRPGQMLPLVPVKAVVVMRHTSSRAADGAPVMRHQADLFVQTDSKTAAVMTRMLGPTASRVAEHGLGQLQLFFSGISGYLERHPDQVETLLRARE